MPEPQAAPPAGMLPAIPVPDRPDLRDQVRGFRIEGGTVFSPAELEQALAPWLGREIGSEDLVAIRNALAGLYVDAGYVNSGAVIPDQDMADGFIEIVLVEGSLGRIEVTDTKYYRPGVIADRIRVQVPGSPGADWWSCGLVHGRLSTIDSPAFQLKIELRNAPVLSSIVFAAGKRQDSPRNDAAVEASS